ncbi:MAG: hypothetical protein HDS68_01805 [Bacteroidales bacterium]|nr:hypothetical protein [Bacteroidales bacterium]
MRKILLSLSAAAVACAASATINVEYQWNNVVNAGDAVMSTVNSVATAPEGDYYVGASFAKSESVKWGDTDLTPSEEMTTAYQRNWTLGRISSDGTMKWHITAINANIANNSLRVAQTPDGGVVMMANATFNSNAGGGAPELMKFTDTKGNAVTLELNNAPEEKSPYAGVLIKFSADGEMEWNSVVGADGYESAGKFDANVVSFNALAVDSEGNVYAGGVYKTALVLGDNQESRFAINLGVESNGKVTNNGDAFIARFDNTGKNTGFLTSSASAPYAAKESLSAMTIDGNTLYCALIVDGAENLKYNLFDVETEVSSDFAANIVYGKVDLSTFKCTEAGALTANKTEISASHNAQIQNIQAIGDRLYISGSNNGALEQNGTTVASSSSNKLENTTIAVDPATMAATTAYVTNSDNIGNDFYVIRDTENGKVYTIAYQLTGTFGNLYQFEEDGTLDQAYVLASGTSNMTPALFNNDTKQLLVPMYAKGLAGLGGTEAATETFGSFHGFLTSFRLPDVTTTGVTDVTAGDAADAQAEYFNLQGMMVKNPAAGTLVIRRQGNEVSKMIVR